MKREIVITLSPENENQDVVDLDDLLSFIVNELENANIGAYLEIKETDQ
jgi:hypothetical protein